MYFTPTQRCSLYKKIFNKFLGENRFAISIHTPTVETRYQNKHSGINYHIVLKINRYSVTGIKVSEARCLHSKELVLRIKYIIILKTVFLL